MRNLELALTEWTALLSPEHVSTSSEERAAHERATYLTTQQVAAVVRPGSVEEVQACVRIANRHRVALYPISGGKNWGYGSRVPPQTDSVLLDLRRLDQISHFDVELACVTVQAGVTQTQLATFLDRADAPLWLDPTASSADASVIGNLMERGHGMTAYADHVSHASALEVVLPTGERITTGFGQFGDPELARFDRWGPGPALDGLFTQSNLGIVTSATIWLMPAPDCTRVASFALDDDSGVARAIDALRPLRLDGTIGAGPRFANEVRILQAEMQYPFEQTGGAVPLPRDLALRLCKERGLGPWMGFLALYGTATKVDADQTRVGLALDGIVRALRFVSEEASVGPMSSRSDRYVHRVLRVARGHLAPATFRTYWRKRITPSFDRDPDRDACGVIFCPTALPLRGADARVAFQIVRAIVSKYGFDPDINLDALRHRSLHAHFSIVYDREVPGEDERALECQAELVARLAERGYHAPRLGLHTMNVLATAQPEYGRLVRQIKTALDPNGVLAPGRYESMPPKLTDWSTRAEAWRRWAPKMMAWRRPLHDALFALLQPKAGESVIDLATGIGEPGLMLASQMSDVRVVGCDVSDAMLSVARERAVGDRVMNYQTVLVDGTHLPFVAKEFDASICCFGLEFMSDPEASLRELWRVLKPNARLVVVTWGPPSRNPFHTVASEAIRAGLGESPRNQESLPLFRWSDPRALADLLSRTGFHDATNREFAGVSIWQSVEEFWTMKQETSDAVRALDRASTEQRGEIVRRVHADCAPYLVDDELRLPYATWLTEAMR